MVVAGGSPLSGMRIFVTFPAMNRWLGGCLKVESWSKLSPEANSDDGWVGAHAAPGGWQGGGGDHHHHRPDNLLSSISNFSQLIKFGRFHTHPCGYCGM